VPVEGEVVADFQLSNRSYSVLFDFQQPARRVQSVVVNGDPVAPLVTAGHVVIHQDSLQLGDNRVSIRFEAGDESLNRRDGYLYSLFVPDRASLAFPCFDQPDLKGRFTLELDMPAGWVSVANSRMEELVSRGDRSVVRFAETEPLSTYLFAFAAGEFQSLTQSVDGREMTLFHRETDQAKLERNTEEVFRLHSAALDWLEEYTGIPYPFGKFDFVLIPAFQFGGMEHPGSILYKDSSLLLDESATQSQFLNRARLIAHETAHMWFGDLVTMRWFDDVWTKEVFANFMAAKIVNPSFPEVDHDLRFLLSHYPSAYEVDRSAGTHAIRQELDNLNEAASLYGAIIYQKSPIVMRHLEQMMGEKLFQEGLGEYLKAFAFGNATWPELIEILDRKTSKDLKSWSRQWVEEAGRPEIRTQIIEEAGGSFVVLQQFDPLGRGQFWPQELQVISGKLADLRSNAVHLSKTETTVRLDLDEAGPFVFLPNGDGFGYGSFRLDPVSRKFLLDSLHAMQPDQVRAAAWITLWEEFLEGHVEPGELFRLMLTSLRLEQNEQIVELQLSYLRRLYWNFLPIHIRLAASAEMEELLWDLLRRSRSTSLKSAYFRAFRSVSSTPEGNQRLEELWRGSLVVDGLSLSEDDQAALALELAVRELPGWSEILDEQETRIQNPERLQRFSFVRPFLSADPVEREASFRALSNLENRSKEPWVVEALRYLHHPVRSESSVHLILPALQLLGEVERTGDIFFPKRWLDAVLASHRTPEAAGVVLQYLRTCQYRARLKGKILQSVDSLLRAARLSAGPEAVQDPIRLEQ